MKSVISDFDIHTNGKKTMRDMEPMEVCVIDDKRSECNGHVVMRTPSEFHFQVFSLTDKKTCWIVRNGLAVKSFDGKRIVFHVKQKE